MDLGLQGRRAAVAAASTGLGFACAEALAAEGAIVAICGRDTERIKRAAEMIGSTTIPLAIDVGTASGATSFVDQAAAALGGYPEILVTNGGGPPSGTFASTPYDRYQPALETNLLSPIAMCLAAIPHMQSAGWGRVIAITSISAKQPLGELILSSTARTGLSGFLKTVATEVAAHGVTVNSVLPAYHATDRVRDLYGDDPDIASQLPVGELGRPADFGAVVAFLASAQARFITGTALAVDGGSGAGVF